jgi:hypothetical protein
MIDYTFLLYPPLANRETLKYLMNSFLPQLSNSSGSRVLTIAYNECVLCLGQNVNLTSEGLLWFLHTIVKYQCLTGQRSMISF